MPVSFCDQLHFVNSKRNLFEEYCSVLPKICGKKIQQYRQIDKKNVVAFTPNVKNKANEIAIKIAVFLSYFTLIIPLVFYIGKTIQRKIASLRIIELSSQGNPLIPYQIIRQSNFNKVIKKVITLIYGSKFDNFAFGPCGPLGPYKFQSCVNTMYALSLIFLGVEATKKIAEDHTVCCRVDVPVPLPSGKTWNFSIESLFEGNISANISNDCQLDDNKYREFYLNKFKKTIQPLIDSVKSDSDEKTIKGIQEKFSCLHYPFNKTTIELLQKDIFERNKKVNEKQTFIYILSLQVSKVGEKITEHAWILEQFLNEETKGVAFRLYQSWIGQATLMDDLAKQGKKPWNFEKLKEFLLSLETFCCSYGENSTLQCFGYSDHSHPLLQFDGKSFFGKILTYQTYEIDPAQCLNNYKNLQIK